MINSVCQLDSTTCPTPEPPVSAMRFAPEAQGWKVAAKNLGMRAAGRLAAWLRVMGGNRASGKLGILTYHRIAPPVPGCPSPYYNVDPNRFREQIFGLKRRGYTFLTLEEALRQARHGEFKARSVVVTFDDGFQNVYTRAFPILCEANVPATIFVNTGYLDSASPFPFDAWAARFAQSAPSESWLPLTRAQCREMQATGLISLGAHTHTHQDFRGRVNDFERDTTLSVDKVREWFGVQDVTFAFPYGSTRLGLAGGELEEAVRRIRVSCALTTDTLHVEPRSDPRNWGRFNVFEWDTSATLAGKLDGWYTWAQYCFRIVNRSPASVLERAIETPESSLHIVYLTNMIPPHLAPVLREVKRHCRRLTVLVSTPMESDRDWDADWDSLEVVVQKTLTRTRRVNHPDGFAQEYPTHVPWDTIARLRRLKPDVVISSEMGVRSILAAIYSRLLVRTPLVLDCGLSEHTERNVGWLPTKLRRILARTADHLASTGTSGVRYLQSLGAEPERVTVTPYSRVPRLSNGRDKNLRSGAPTRLLFVGRLIELKGLAPFARGLAEWARANPKQLFEFWLAGEGPERRALEQVALPGNLTLKMLGALDFDQLNEVYLQCDVFVLPTLTDEWALVVDEALAAGMPVLGSIYAQAVTDLVREGVNGWQYDPRQPEQLQKALSEVFATSAEQLTQMRTAAYRSVEHRTPQFAAECIMQSVRSAVERHRLRRKKA